MLAKKLQGVILAGGMGSRLMPLTKITNKHLLPVYNQAMILYPIKKMLEAGIDEIVLVTGGAHAGEFVQLLGNGKEYGLKSLHYCYQEGDGGIADALRMVEKITKDSPLAVILGDNLFDRPITEHVRNFRENPTGGYVVLTKVKDPKRFGIATFDRNNRIVKITEKPRKPASSFAVTGLYFYDSSVFKVIKGIRPSRRGELEITDVNNHYLKAGTLRHGFVKGKWLDCGTIETLHKASVAVQKSLKKRK